MDYKIYALHKKKNFERSLVNNLLLPSLFFFEIIIETIRINFKFVEYILTL